MADIRAITVFCYFGFFFYYCCCCSAVKNNRIDLHFRRTLIRLLFRGGKIVELFQYVICYQLCDICLAIRKRSKTRHDVDEPRVVHSAVKKYPAIRERGFIDGFFRARQRFIVLSTDENAIPLYVGTVTTIPVVRYARKRYYFF